MAKFNVDKAKAGGMTDEAIQSYLSQHPELEAKQEMTGDLRTDLTNQGPAILKDAASQAISAPETAMKSMFHSGVLPGQDPLINVDKVPSVDIPVNTGILPPFNVNPRSIAQGGAKLAEDAVSPTGLAINAGLAGASEIAPAILKGSSQVVGKLLSGKSTKTIGKLFDQPDAMLAGAKEMVTKGAQKAFGAAKDITGIRQLKRGPEALDSAKDAVKNLFDVRDQVAARVKELVSSGAEKAKALKYAVTEANLPEATLEARQGIDAMSGKIMETPAGNALRNRFNASLAKIAPLVREADPGVAKAALGKEFLQLMPEGFGRRVIATAGLGGSVLNPALIAPTVGFSPFATGVGTSLAGAASKGIEGLGKNGLRRALISALASRMNNNSDQEGK